MNYRVILQKYAELDLEDAYRRAAANAPQAATRWLDRFQSALATLAKSATVLVGEEKGEG